MKSSLRSLLALLALAGCSRTDVFADAGSVVVAPDFAKVALGQTQQFAATVVPAGAAVVWSVSPAGAGTVDATGLYSAPAAFPQPAMAGMKATVRAALEGSPDVFAEAEVRVVAGPAAKLEKVSGDGQTVVVGQAPPAPFVVRAVDATGALVPDVTVVFASPLDEEENVTVVTGDLGEAAGSPKAGKLAGSQTFQVTSEGLAAVTFAATAVAGPLDALRASHPDAKGHPGDTLAQPLSLKFVDAFGNPLAGQAARATPPAGGAAVAQQATSGADGIVPFAITLGSGTGVQTFRFQSIDNAAVQTSLDFTALGGPPARLEIVSGDWQEAVVNTIATEALVVRVLDSTGIPATGGSVTWTASPGAVLVTSEGTPDGAGLARARVKLGTAAGFARVTADAGPIADSPATFTLRALPGPATRLTYVSGSNQSTGTGAVFGGAFTVRVTDASGNGVAGTPVTFSVLSGGGSVSPATVVSGVDGLAQSTMTAGPTAGPQTFKAEATGLVGSPVSITCTAVGQGNNLTLELVSGDNQTGPAGSELSGKLVAKAVMTIAGNPVGVPLMEITFAVAAGGGSVDPVRVTTGVDGTASATAKLGPLAGPQRFSASLPTARNSPIFFNATATAPGVAALVAVSGGGQTAAPGQALPEPLVVRALDAMGQPMAGVVVTFAAPAGAQVSPASATTGADGKASTQATLGAAPGEQVFTASAPGAAPVSFRETAAAPTGKRLRIVSGQGQSATVGRPLGQPLVVEVVNDAGGAIAGATVTWRTDAPGASILPASTTTDAQGRAQASATLGSQLGTQRFYAESTDATGSPATFTATGTAAPAARLVALSGDGQTARTGAALARPLVVQAQDAMGNGVAGVAVSARAGVGGGTITPASGTSDASGNVSFNATLGPNTGPQTFLAEAAGLAGSPVTFTATATPAVQRVAVSPPGVVLEPGGTQRYAATAIFADGSSKIVTEEASWASGTPATATVSDAAGSRGIATAVASGSTAIRATYGGVTGETQLKVEAATLRSIIIYPADVDIAKGTTRRFRAEGVYSNNQVADVTESAAWTSLQPAIATVSNAAGSKGLVSALTPGTATLSVTLAGVTALRTLTVTAAPLAALEVSPAGIVQPAGTVAPFRATATFQDGTVQDVTASALWSSSDTTKLTVQNAPAQAGLATLIAAGTAQVRATFQTMTASRDVTITAATITSLSVRPGRIDLVVGDSFQFEARATYSDGTIADVTPLAVWSSSAPQTVDVSNAPPYIGRISTLAVGQATITARFGGRSDNAQVTVDTATLWRLQVVARPDRCAKGTLLQLRAVAAYSDSMPADITDQVAWTTSDANIAVVGNGPTSGGVVQCLNEGRVTITAAWRGQTGDAGITVTAATLSSIILTPPSATLARGEMRPFVADGVYTDGSRRNLTYLATWLSDNQAVATASNAPDSRGLVTGIGPGTAHITASLDGVSAQATVSVSSAQLLAIVLNPVNPVVNRRVRVVQFTAIALYDDSSTADVTDQAVWGTSDPQVAYVSNAPNTHGVIVVDSPGQCTVTASYGGKTGSTTLYVRQ